MNQQIKIKVCGMRYENNIKQVAALSPDFMGFILFPGSSRYVGDAFTLSADFPQTIKRVGVFVDATSEEVLRRVAELKLDFVQLHGSETPEFCLSIQKKGVGVFKAFGLDESFEFSILEEYLETCDFFLFDTKTKLHGGSGLQFDWTMLEKYPYDKSIILSGGITANDAARIKNMKHLPIFAVDINSKFELAPAEKDIAKLEHFFNELRS